ncbi:MAG: multicopper oxidase domain-containing protein, partial [Desulfobacterales bacterium]
MVWPVRITSVASIIFIIFFAHLQALAAIVEYDLTIAQQEVNVTGKNAEAMTINGSIPGPTLRFKEGDTARIRVHNKMSVETSIHWHGILVPPEMDGVPYVSFPPIEAASTFTYVFPIRQSVTYWYHCHPNLQEQSGVYGSIVIEPSQKRLKVDHDYVVLLSDWTDENPHEVLRTLKRGSEWYSIQKGS